MSSDLLVSPLCLPQPLLLTRRRQEQVSAMHSSVLFVSVYSLQLLYRVLRLTSTYCFADLFVELDNCRSTNRKQKNSEVKVVMWNKIFPIYEHNQNFTDYIHLWEGSGGALFPARVVKKRIQCFTWAIHHKILVQGKVSDI